MGRREKVITLETHTTDNFPQRWLFGFNPYTKCPIPLMWAVDITRTSNMKHELSTVQDRIREGWVGRDLIIIRKKGQGKKKRDPYIPLLIS